MSKQKHIAIINNEPHVLRRLQYRLANEGYHVSTFSNPILAIRSFNDFHPDLILTDQIIPEAGGFEVYRLLKLSPETSGIPIIIMTDKTDPFDNVNAPETGAEDYLIKPIQMNDLISRIQILFKDQGIHTSTTKMNPGTKNGNIIRHGKLVIDLEKRSVSIDNKNIDLTYSEFEILTSLARKPGKVFSREEIINSNPSKIYQVSLRSVDVSIAGIRKKLGRFRGLIRTVRSMGYRFNDDLED